MADRPFKRQLSTSELLVRRLGGLTSASRRDGVEATAAARAAAAAKFIDQVDPTGELRRSNPAEAQRRADAARRAHYVRMRLNSVRSRAAKAGKTKTADASTSPAVSRESSAKEARISGTSQT